MTLNQLMLITHLAQDALLCLSARRKSSERGVLHWPEPHRSEGQSTAVMSRCSKIRGRVLLVYTDIQRYTNYRNSRVPSIRYRFSKLASEELFYFCLHRPLCQLQSCAAPSAGNRNPSIHGYVRPRVLPGLSDATAP